MTLQKKIEKLENILSSLNPLIVAYSGGVDSSFLLIKSSQIPGLRIMAVTIKTPYIQSRETDEAIDFCKTHNIRHQVLHTDIIQEIINNPADRCYYCKRHLFNLIRDYARKNGFSYVADGSNADDLNSFRPGLKALKELEIRSPLLEAGLTKEEIRKILRESGFNIWDKPPMTCLLTRFPYNVQFSADELRMVDEAENYLFEQGYYGSRVRMHGDIVRIECLPGFIEKITSNSNREKIVSKFKEIGFKYISLDLEGYRSGSMDTFAND